MLETQSSRTMHDALQRAHEERAQAARQFWGWMLGGFSFR